MDIYKSKETDELLISLITNGDEQALALLYERKCRLVYSLVHSLVNDISDAEEITQEVFLKVWSKADSFESAKGSVVSWIVTITRRKAIDRLKSKSFKKRSKEVVFSAEDIDNNPDRIYGSRNDNTVMSEEVKIVNNALNKLDESQRQVIQLSHYEGLSHSRIADQLNTPLGTVKSRIRNAVIQLRQYLKVEV